MSTISARQRERPSAPVTGKFTTTAVEPAIMIADLVKRFDDVTAVNHLNLTIHKGEMFCFTAAWALCRLPAVRRVL